MTGFILTSKVCRPTAFDDDGKIKIKIRNKIRLKGILGFFPFPSCSLWRVDNPTRQSWPFLRCICPCAVCVVVGRLWLLHVAPSGRSHRHPVICPLYYLEPVMQTFSREQFVNLNELHEEADIREL